MGTIEALGAFRFVRLAAVLALALSAAGCAAGAGTVSQASHGARRVPVYYPTQDPALYNYDDGSSG
jgi:hypothetical protein